MFGVSSHFSPITLAVCPLLVGFRREIGDDFLEPRIAAERIPEGQQL
jgi:hypothetical protein